MPTIPSFTLSASLTPAAPRPGQALTATVTLHNAGAGTITNAVLTVTPPAGVVSAVTTPQGTFAVSGSTLIFTLGTIAAGATLSAVATIESQAPGTATVAASLASDQGTAGPAAATVTAATKRPTASGLRRLGSRPSGLPPGVYSLKKTTDGLDLADLPPGIVGVFFQTNWKLIETAEDVFDWSAIDAVIASAAANDLVVELSLGMGGAGQTPAYVSGLPGVTTFSYYNTSIFQSTYGQLVSIPIPWDAAVLARKVNFIRQAGARYVNEPCVRAVSVNGAANGQGDDWYWPSFQGSVTLPDTSVVAVDQVADWRAAGYTTAKALAACQAVLNAAAGAFPGRTIEHPIASADPDLETAPDLDARACTLCNQIMAYGWARWPNRFLPKWHRLKVTTPAGDDPAVTGAAFDTGNTKFLKFAQNPRRFGWQFASHATAPGNARQDGGGINDPDSDPLTVLDDSFAAALDGYVPRVVEIWKQDATEPTFAAAIAAMTDTLRTMHAGN